MRARESCKQVRHRQKKLGIALFVALGCLAVAGAAMIALAIQSGPILPVVESPNAADDTASNAGQSAGTQAETTASAPEASSETGADSQASSAGEAGSQASSAGEADSQAGFAVGGGAQSGSNASEQAIGSISHEAAAQAVSSNACPVSLSNGHEISRRGNGIGHGWTYETEDSVECVAASVIHQLSEQGWSLVYADTVDLFGQAWGCVAKDEATKRVFLAWIAPGELSIGSSSSKLEASFVEIVASES